MTGFKKLTVPRQSSYNSLYVNPLTESRHSRCCSEGGGEGVNTFSDDKENAVPNKKENVASDDKENAAPLTNAKQFSALKSLSTKMNEPDKAFGLRLWEANDSEHSTEHSSSLKIWDFSDSEAAPASSWSTLPNRALLCRPLPLDIGRCTCVIVKEACPRGLKGVPLFSLYTNEGQGRQNRKLAVAYHKRRNGKSQFTIAQNTRGIKSKTDDSFIGTVTANLMGSKYHIRDQAVSQSTGSLIQFLPLFVPTITTLTGSYRSMRAYIPKHQSMLLKSTTHISSADSKVQHINGLPKDWEGKLDKVHKLSSRIPQYNNISKQYELDYRDRGRAGLRIQSSVKNFQLTLEEDGRQTILQLGRVGKSKYVMDFRYPLTGYQAFCICLASIDSKLCCTI
ncbi:hypothetical protein Patl1_34827 [Pistacia atlantica]|uniref:Uncharacterized protein n=1 Tax=Pistacia atlantica TaxID=434234 RepID=A0ACC0ZS71_9ROSI|nr:hypothetical protein Patl1_34827 [Pistacia atlantica]